MQPMNLETIKNTFDLQGNNIEELRKELTKKMSEIHPDKNQGEFINKTDENAYYKMSEAVEYLDSNISSSTSLITVSEAKELFDMVSKQVALITNTNTNNEMQAKTQTQTQTQILSQKSSSSLHTFKRRYKLPKITTTAVSAVLTAMFLFPNQIKEHPVLGKVIDIESAAFFNFWICALAITIFLWLYFFAREQQQELFLKKLNSTYYQNHLFQDYLRGKIHSEHQSLLTKEEFIQNLKFYRRPKNLMLNIRSTIDPEIAETIAEVVFARAEEKGFIKQHESNSLEDQYLVVKELESNLHDRINSIRSVYS